MYLLRSGNTHTDIPNHPEALPNTPEAKEIEHSLHRRNHVIFADYSSQFSATVNAILIALFWSELH